jgi:hypothetical protein
MNATAVSAPRGATAGLPSSASATQPCFATQSTATQDRPRARRPWKPDGTDHLIFQWAKMEGRSQGWVAMQLNISQATVSRVVQRYERWQAHAKEREGGRLDPSERLRAQRWLTFERNELMLASCLRIAGKLEDVVDSSRSTIRRPLSDPLAESEVRTEHFTLDRTGMAARFLRLAFKINMEQLKLAELEQPPLPEPLTAEELDAEERADAAAAEELARLHTARRVGAAHQDVATEPNDVTGSQDSAAELETELVTRVPPGNALPRGSSLAESPTRPEPRDPAFPGGSLGTSDAEPSTNHHSPAPVHNVHNLHSENVSEIGATAAEPCSCVSQPHAEENSPTACITDQGQPNWTGDDRSKDAKRRRATAARS